MDDFTDLRAMWAEADKIAIDYRSTPEIEHLKTIQKGIEGLKAHGWRDATYCPKDGTRFLAIEPGSVGVFPCYYQGEWPNGHWWIEAHGDLWPARPILYKDMPKDQPK